MTASATPENYTTFTDVTAPQVRRYLDGSFVQRIPGVETVRRGLNVVHVERDVIAADVAILGLHDLLIRRLIAERARCSSPCPSAMLEDRANLGVRVRPANRNSMKRRRLYDRAEKSCDAD
jgi:hypothetical protein